MPGPPEYTGNPESFLSRVYRGHHIPVTESEKLWADTACLQDDLDVFGEEQRFTAKVLNRLLKYKQSIRKIEDVTPEPSLAESVPASEKTDEEESRTQYKDLTELLDRLTQRIHYYEKDCVSRMIKFLIKEREYKPGFGECKLTVREEGPLTEGKVLRFRIHDLLERLTHEKRRLRELRKFVKEDLNFKGFDDDKKKNKVEEK